MDSLTATSRANAAVLNLPGADQGAGMSDMDNFAFSRMISDFMRHTPAEITPELDTHTSWQGDNTFLATNAPYTGQSDSARQSAFSTLESSSRIAIADIRFIDSEIQQIADSLRLENPQAAGWVEDLAGHPGGVTVAEVVQAAATQEAVSLSEGDLVRIENLALELDPTGELGTDMLADIREGDIVGAWSRLDNALNKLDADSTVSVNREGILALGKGLGLSEDTLSKLKNAFGEAETLNLTRDGLKKLLAPAIQELTRKAESHTKLALALETVLSDVVISARKRLEAEAQASGQTSRRVEQSQVLIEDTVTRNGFNRQPTVENSVKEVAGKTQNLSEKISERVSEKITDKISDKMPDQTMRKDGNAPAGQKEQFGLFDHNGNGTRQKASANPWEALLQRIDVAARTPGTVPLTSVSTGTAGLHNTGNTAQTTAHLSAYSTQVLNQVEKGVLSALSNGTRRLELQLNPVELGAVNVLLTTKNGEVSALLRPERPETASLLMQQLSDLRADLEQQGLKVDKVDVQTQVRDENGSTWQGMNQHNATYEQRARIQELDRLRRLGRIVGIGEGTGSVTGPVSRPDMAGMSRLLTATSGMHLVA